MITLHVQDFQWVKGEDDNPEDQCAHGRVLFHVNNTIFMKPEDGIWTVSASALYLMRTLSEDHTLENPVAESNFLFPCCGFTVWPSGKRFKVLCMGCNTGVDVEIIHRQDTVTVSSAVGTKSVSKSEWIAAVLGFVNSVRDFYRVSSPKVAIEDEYDHLGWTAFWQEWDERYQLALSMSG